MIKFIYGTMNSGKTVHLIKTYEIYKRKQLNPVIIKRKVDDREGVFVGWGTTKSRLMDKTVPAYYYGNILDAVKLDCKTILVDEAQFMSKKDVNYLITYANEVGIDVIAFGLKTDINGNLFEGSSAWISMADELKEIENICEISGCTCKANYHNRYINGKRDVLGKSVMIDKGDVSYKSVCYKHWREI